MTVPIVACGFELYDSDEYTTSSGLTIESTYKYISPRYARVTANGYVSWTTSIAKSSTVYYSCHVRLPLSSHIKPLKMTRGGSEFSVSFDDSGSTSRTVYVNRAGSSTSFTYVVADSDWINVVLEVSSEAVKVYIDGKQRYASYASYSGASGTVTQIRSEAAYGAGSSTMYVDDVALWWDDYNGEVPLVLAYRPEGTGDYHVYGTYPTNYNGWYCIYDETSDSDTTYVYLSSSAETEGGYYRCGIVGLPYYLKFSKVLALDLYQDTRCTSDTGNETSTIGLTSGGIYFDPGPIYGTSHNVSTGYVTYMDQFTGTSGGSLKPDNFASYSPYRLQVILKMAAPSSTIRCTKIRGNVLGLFTATSDKPYNPTTSIIATGGWELSFDVASGSWSVGTGLSAFTNVKTLLPGKNMESENSDLTHTMVGFIKTSSSTMKIYFCQCNDTGGGIKGQEELYIPMGTASDMDMHIRIVMHDNFISLFESERWLYTFSTAQAVYPDVLTLELLSSASMTISNVVASELCDWREAIYIDTQTSIASGISSVIQQRPVEMVPQVGGIVDFSYNRSRSNITPGFIFRHTKTHINNQNAGSHYIVYFSDVAMVVDEDFMDSDGYVTRMLQMSELDSGAAQAATIMAQRAREAQERHTLELAPDIRIEPGDKITISYTASGTGTVVSDDMIAESVSIQIEEGQYTQTVGGRGYV